MNTASEQAYDKVIDARGRFCPGPLLELIRGLKALRVDGLIEVISSDPGSNTDIPLWVARAGHQLIETQAGRDGTHFVVRKLH